MLLPPPARLTWLCNRRSPLTRPPPTAHRAPRACLPTAARFCAPAWAHPERSPAGCVRIRTRRRYAHCHVSPPLSSACPPRRGRCSLLASGRRLLCCLHIRAIAVRTATSAHHAVTTARSCAAACTVPSLVLPRARAAAPGASSRRSLPCPPLARALVIPPVTCTRVRRHALPRRPPPPLNYAPSAHCAAAHPAARTRTHLRGSTAS